MALSSVTLALTERDGYIDLVWTPDDTPISSWEIARGGDVIKTLYDVNAVSWRDIDVENNTAYSYVVTGQTDAVASAAVVGVPNPRAHGVIDPLAATIRYTTLAEVTQALGVNQYDDTHDDLVTQTIISVESAIDQHLGRSFPDPSAGEIEGIPEAIKQVALTAAVAAYTNVTAPAGESGSDDWFGSQDVGVGEIIRRDVRRNPLLTGYRVGFGVAGGSSR